MDGRHRDRIYDIVILLLNSSSLLFREQSISQASCECCGHLLLGETLRSAVKPFGIVRLDKVLTVTTIIAYSELASTRNIAVPTGMSECISSLSGIYNERTQISTGWYVLHRRLRHSHIPSIPRKTRSSRPLALPTIKLYTSPHNQQSPLHTPNSTHTVLYTLPTLHTRNSKSQSPQFVLVIPSWCVTIIHDSGDRAKKLTKRV
jgi:hypothetical protein